MYGNQQPSPQRRPKARFLKGYSGQTPQWSSSSGSSWARPPQNPSGQTPLRQTLSPQRSPSWARPPQNPSEPLRSDPSTSDPEPATEPRSSWARPPQDPSGQNPPRQTPSGQTLTNDLANVLDEKIFHDVAIICSDGVEVGASRIILAGRSPVLKAMLFGEMREASSGQVLLPEIDSATLRIVLRFIYTGDIQPYIPLSPEVTIDVFKASSFFILPELSNLTVSHATPVPSIEYAPCLLNKAVKYVPPSKENATLYAILMAPFLKQELQLSHLNGLSAEALEVLLMDAKDPRTTEFHLLACVVSWALFNDEFAISDPNHMVLLDYIYETEDDCLPNRKFDVSEQARDSIIRMLPYIKLDLICPHRFRVLTKLIDGLVDPSPISAAVFDYACKHVVCPRGHPSKRRGEEDVKVGDIVVEDVINGVFGQIRTRKKEEEEEEEEGEVWQGYCLSTSHGSLY